MSTTEQINAYLTWRSEHEGKTVDVSAEAYERHKIIEEIFAIAVEYHQGGDEATSALLDLYELTQDYYRLENN